MMPEFVIPKREHHSFGKFSAFNSASQFLLPPVIKIIVQVTPHELCLASRAKRVYANAHTYHINSISVNSDQATFLSADDLRINLWDLEVTNRSFNIVDIKPANMEDLTEVKQLLQGAGSGSLRCAWSHQNTLCLRYNYLLGVVLHVD
eukprot:GHRQ01015955.1.p1 GENE.GHRQ01015955.1~~GHRQ01015955.1.p1  ORF type:complete len:148 (-),score=25.39 GHRQ01015955.1:357-800(-)